MDANGFTLAECDYVSRDTDDDTIQKSYTSSSRAVCNIGASNPAKSIGHYNFGTQTYEQGRGKMHSKFSYIGPAPEYKWFDFTLDVSKKVLNRISVSKVLNRII